jgi:Phosphoinositide phospholipase C, Ca2+-dependent
MPQRTVRPGARRRGRAVLAVFLGAAAALSACSAGKGEAAGTASAPRLNQIQFLASHNSYHVRAEQPLFDTMLKFSEDLVRTIEYSHPPLDEQLDLGLRGFELDVFADPEGGRYRERRGPRILNLPTAVGPAELAEPGFKVMHVQDIDFASTCLTFVACLTTVKEWSDAHPAHLPIFIQVEPKEDTLDLAGLDLVEALPYTPALMTALTAEVRSVFTDDDLLTPDDVRQGATTLAAGLRANGWPTVDRLRGKVMFALGSSGPQRDALMAAFPGTRGGVLFPDSAPGDPFAAFAGLDDPQTPAQQRRIRAALDAGMLVRTRTDADLLEGRTGDTTRAAAAFASGAQVVSTDFFRPLPEIAGDFVVRLPQGGVARCDPVTAPPGCVVPREAAPARKGTK